MEVEIKKQMKHLEFYRDSDKKLKTRELSSSPVEIPGGKVEYRSIDGKKLREEIVKAAKELSQENSRSLEIAKASLLASKPDDSTLDDETYLEGKKVYLVIKILDYRGEA